jgi:hypothetical protein
MLWWKNEEPPQCQVHAAGRIERGDWQKNEAGWNAVVSTASFFTPQSTLPLRFEVSCENLKIESHVISDAPGAFKVLSLSRESVQLRNTWYALEVTAAHGGALTHWSERGRNVDYFASRDDLIHTPLEWGGHTDRYRNGPWGGWADKAAETTLDSVEIRRLHGSSKVQMAGSLEDDLRTTTSYSLFDEWPLLLIEREWTLHAKKDDKKEGPREPIDDLRLMQLSFRTAARVERDGAHGSRILCADGERLNVTHSVDTQHLTTHWNWTMRDGWAIFEHPLRNENLLYLFDTAQPPHLATWLSTHYVTFEPIWPAHSLKTGNATGYALAMASGELCGASAAGGWVACRVPHDGKVLCGVVARLREPKVVAQFRLGNQTREVSLQSTLLPGVGTIAFATTEFDEDGATIEVVVGDIAGRRIAGRRIA